jgi:hypothetical protein
VFIFTGAPVSEDKENGGEGHGKEATSRANRDPDDGSGADREMMPSRGIHNFSSH